MIWGIIGGTFIVVYGIFVLFNGQAKGQSGNSSRTYLQNKKLENRICQAKNCKNKVGDTKPNAKTCWKHRNKNYKLKPEIQTLKLKEKIKQQELDEKYAKKFIDKMNKNAQKWKKRNGYK